MKWPYEYESGIIVGASAKAVSIYVVLDGPDKRILGHESDDHLAIRASYLPTSLKEAVRQLSEMKKNYSGMLMGSSDRDC